MDPSAGPAPPRGVVVRDAVAADVHDVAVFQTRTWREAYAGLVSPDYLLRVGVPEREASWSLRIASTSRHVVVARAGASDARAATPAAGRVVGVASWGLGDPADPADLDLPELKTLYVAASSRGTGLAHTLLHRALGDAPGYLWVFERNARAVAFYRRHGFAPDGARKLDVGPDVHEVRLVRR